MDNLFKNKYMNKYYIIFFIISFSIIIKAQDTLTSKNVQISKNFATVKLTSLPYTGVYKSILKNNFYYTNYVNGVRNGLARSIENNILVKISNYKNNKLDGVEIYYHAKTGLKVSEKNYKENELDGKALEYWPNGNLKKEENYEYGKKVGNYKKYYDNGNLEQEYFFISNKSSFLKYFHRNGYLSKYFEKYRGETINYNVFDSLGNFSEQCILDTNTNYVIKKCFYPSSHKFKFSEKENIKNLKHGIIQEIDSVIMIDNKKRTNNFLYNNFIIYDKATYLHSKYKELKIRKYYPNGKLELYIFNKSLNITLVDTLIEYYPNGAIKTVGYNDINELKWKGPEIHWDSTGIVIQKKYKYSSDKIFTIVDSTWNKNQAIKQLLIFNGFCLSNDEKDTVLKKQYFENGFVKSETDYDAKTYKEYYLNRKIKVVGNIEIFRGNKKIKIPDGLWTYYDSLGNVCNYRFYEQTTEGNEKYIVYEKNAFNLLPFKNKYKFGLINQNGQVVLPCQFNKIYFSSDKKHEGYVVTNYNEKSDDNNNDKLYGFVLANGNVELDAIYSRIVYLSGTDFVFVTNDNINFQTYNFKIHKFIDNLDENDDLIYALNNQPKYKIKNKKLYNESDTCYVMNDSIVHLISSSKKSFKVKGFYFKRALIMPVAIVLTPIYYGFVLIFSFGVDGYDLSFEYYLDLWVPKEPNSYEKIYKYDYEINKSGKIKNKNLKISDSYK